MNDATTGTTPPGEVRDYLVRLGHLTGDLPPHVREELLGSIEEHLRHALDRGELDDAFLRLGSAQEVAAAARHEAGGPPTSPAGVATTSGSGTARLATGAALLLVLLLTALGAWLAVLTGTDPVGPLTPHPGEVVLLVLGGLVAGAVVSVLALLARTLTRSDRWALTAAWAATLAAVPVAVAVAAVAPPPARWVVALGVLVVGGWACVRVARVARPRRRRRGTVGG